MRMSADTEAFIRRQVVAVPDLDPLLVDHMDFHFQRMLPHLMFGDITRWA